MKVYLDTNIVVDYLAHREPFFYDASLVFTLISEGIVEGGMSALSVVNCAYVLRKHYDKTKVLNAIRSLMEFIEVTPISSEIIDAALDDTPYDFEDAVQYESSKDFMPDCIVSRDKRGFKQFIDIPVMTPQALISRCQQ